mmetsp:Transcript_82710/g.229555  ORF Transcript_82710/g.229555 Transcript_82710/m.229555 type:complete len:222 (-) Transcript_82710:1036-1701(-)
MQTSVQGQAPGPWAGATAQSSRTRHHPMPASLVPSRLCPSFLQVALPPALASSVPTQRLSRHRVGCRSLRRHRQHRQRLWGLLQGTCGPMQGPPLRQGDTQQRATQQREPTWHQHPVHLPASQAARSRPCQRAFSQLVSKRSRSGTLPTTSALIVVPTTQNGPAFPSASSSALSVEVTTGIWAHTSQESAVARWTRGRSGNCRYSTTVATGTWERFLPQTG